MAPSETEFEFDDMIVNSQVYGRFIGQVANRRHLKVREEVGDPIDSSGTTARLGKDLVNVPVARLRHRDFQILLLLEQIIKDEVFEARILKREVGNIT
ncbi:hypothetical protein GGR54DRAFT_643994 [Hypoxylon sp. NC1633]|nr:hypothetical protein GGR54DRAFT_643994 [Hypoxylon sp. NC1633]